MTPQLIFAIGTFISFPLILASVLFARRQLISFFLHSNNSLSLFQLIRRLIGSGLTIAISVMLFWGCNIMNMPNQPIKFIQFWIIWFSLTLILIIILFWDWMDTRKNYLQQKRQITDELIAKTFGENVKKIELDKDNVVYVEK